MFLLQILRSPLKNKPNHHIVHDLLNRRVVEHRLTHIYEKLGVCSRTEAVIKLMHLYEK